MLLEFLNLAVAKRVYNRLKKGGVRGSNPKEEKEIRFSVLFF